MSRLASGVAGLEVHALGEQQGYAMTHQQSTREHRGYGVEPFTVLGYGAAAALVGMCLAFATRVRTRARPARAAPPTARRRNER